MTRIDPSDGKPVALCGNYQLVPTSREVLAAAKKLLREANSEPIGDETINDIGDRIAVAIRALQTVQNELDNIEKLKRRQKAHAAIVARRERRNNRPTPKVADGRHELPGAGAQAQGDRRRNLR
jgi:hypothetical protein